MTTIWYLSERRATVHALCETWPSSIWGQLCFHHAWFLTQAMDRMLLVW